MFKVGSALHLLQNTEIDAFAHVYNEIIEQDRTS